MLITCVLHVILGYWSLFKLIFIIFLYDKCFCLVLNSINIKNSWMIDWNDNLERKNYLINQNL